MSLCAMSAYEFARHGRKKPGRELKGAQSPKRSIKNPMLDMDIASSDDDEDDGGEDLVGQFVVAGNIVGSAASNAASKATGAVTDLVESDLVESVEDVANALIDTVMVVLRVVITTVFAPLATFWAFLVLTDILLNSPWLEDGSFTTRTPEFVVLVVMPFASFTLSCYMLVSFWMDPGSWSRMRWSVSFGNLPMCTFFALVLAGQSPSYQFGTSCATRKYLLEMTYLMMNAWHTATIWSSYNIVVKNDKRNSLNSKPKDLRPDAKMHLVCWGVPIGLIVLLRVAAAFADVNVLGVELPTNSTRLGPKQLVVVVVVVVAVCACVICSPRRNDFNQQTIHDAGSSQHDSIAPDPRYQACARIRWL